MQPLLLLHGAIGAADQLQPLAEALSNHYEVHRFSFSGHGGKEIPKAGLSIALFANELRDYIETHGLQGAPVFGYSMGGYVALYLAKTQPGLISKIITLATKFEWNGEIAERECAMLNPEKIEAKLPAFAHALAARHAPVDWKEVLGATAVMLRAMGAENPLKETDYPALDLPVLLLLGDRDKMVGLDETRRAFNALPKGALGVLPQTAHPIEQVDVSLLAFLIQGFLKAVFPEKRL